MKVSFDSFDRLEQPAIILCNPGSVYDDGMITNALGELTHVSDVEIEMNFNSQSKLNFRLYHVDQNDGELAEYELKLYRMVANKRYIYVDGFGYFIITECTNVLEGDFRYKDITASSCEAELSSVLVPYLDGTYRMVTSGDDIGLLNILIERMQNWTIGEVDQDAAALYRTFVNLKKKTTGDISGTSTSMYNNKNVSDTTSIYEFLMNEFQDAYECIVLFDTVNRTVNIYDQKKYIQSTEVHMTSKDLVNKIQMLEDDSNIYTALRVLGYDDLDISDVNPTGTNIIYNFDAYKSWMSAELQQAIEDWEDAIEDNLTRYFNAMKAYEGYALECYNLQLEISRLNTVLALYQQVAANITAAQNTKTLYESDESIVSNGGVPVPIQESVQGALDDTNALIDSLTHTGTGEIPVAQASLTQAESNRDAAKAIVDSILESTSLEGAFTAAQLSELSWYIFEGNYKYEFIGVTDSMTLAEQFEQKGRLFMRARSALKSASKRRYSFTIDTESFVFVRDYEDWTAQLEPGCGVYIEMEDGVVEELFLSGMTINFEDNNVSFRFGSTIDRDDLRSLYMDIFKDITKTGRSITY